MSPKVDKVSQASIFKAKPPMCLPAEPLLKGKDQYSRPLLLTSLELLVFILKILFTIFTKPASLIRRSIVLSLLPQLVFLGLLTNFVKGNPASKTPTLKAGL
jgi:hypothetical protein